MYEYISNHEQNKQLSEAYLGTPQHRKLSP